MHAPHSEPPIDDRALIGNGHTTMLVRRDGTIDWACLPRFDTPGPFSGMLDPEGGGHLSVRLEGPYTGSQAYLDHSNTLLTTLTGEGGVLEITDFMPDRGRNLSFAGSLTRRLVCLEGTVTVEIEARPAAGMGERPLTGELKSNHLVFNRPGRPPSQVRVKCAGKGEWVAGPDGMWRRTFTLSATQRPVSLRLEWGERMGDLNSLSAKTFEDRGVDSVHPQVSVLPFSEDHPWHNEIWRSANVLKLLIYAPTGAMVAAPTTSLPEWIGGVRNWDYRYTWVRDASLAFTALARAGGLNDAHRFLRFLMHHFPTGDLPLMCTIHGGPVPEEEALDHLAGCHGSKPVRVGNGARDQVQHDIYGPVLDMVWAYVEGVGALRGDDAPVLDDAEWAWLSSVLAQAEGRWQQPDHGIWEPRTGKRHNVHSKLMCWMAFDRGATLAARRGLSEARARWRAQADAVHVDVCTRGLDPTGTHFVNAYGEAEPDGALLLLPIIGFLPPDDARVVATVEWLQSTLSEGHFIHRYRSRHDDGVGGAEGAFLLCGFWLVEALALMGRTEQAAQIFEAHLGCANAVGLLAEEVDPATGAALGNFPQAFSHLGVINAALALNRQQ
ncbi:MAG: glycoside hydrolase family 15 protein [Bradymonadia bacterium]